MAPTNPHIPRQEPLQFQAPPREVSPVITTPVPVEAPSDPEVNRLLADYARTRNGEIRDRIVLRYERLARRIATRFSSSALPFEDVLQVAYIGLIHAIERYDPERQNAFLSYAIPTMVGEIKRYLRDHAWMMQAPRRLRERGLKLQKVREQLEQELGHAPTIQEIAAQTGFSEEEIVTALDVDRAFACDSLDAIRPGADGREMGSLDDMVADDTEVFSGIELRETLRQAIAKLDDRLRRIIQLRYFDGLPQTVVAQDIGVSQMQISRLERQALQRLQSLVAGTEMS